jgi:beta-galactosidase
VVVNHNDEPVQVPATGTELLTGALVDGTLTVPPGLVRVVASSASSS